MMDSILMHLVLYITLYYRVLYRQHTYEYDIKIKNDQNMMMVMEAHWIYPSIRNRYKKMFHYIPFVRQHRMD